MPRGWSQYVTTNSDVSWVSPVVLIRFAAHLDCSCIRYLTYARNRQASGTIQAKRLEARSGFEPLDKGFADLCLTTWLPRLKVRSKHTATGDAASNQRWTRNQAAVLDPSPMRAFRYIEELQRERRSDGHASSRPDSSVRESGTEPIPSHLRFGKRRRAPETPPVALQFARLDVAALALYRAMAKPKSDEETPGTHMRVDWCAAERERRVWRENGSHGLKGDIRNGLA
jgi:hypothetical protein